MNDTSSLTLVYFIGGQPIAPCGFRSLVQLETYCRDQGHPLVDVTSGVSLSFISAIGLVEARFSVWPPR